MVKDIVRAYGYLTLGTRLKRIGERLQAESGEIATLKGAILPASQYPFLATLHENGPLTLGDVAAFVGITQPGATCAVAQLADKGLVEIRVAPEDGRRKIISLTAEGRRQVALGIDVIWPDIAAAVADLCDGLSGSLLEQLAALEDGLADRPLAQHLGTSGDADR